MKEYVARKLIESGKNGYVNMSDLSDSIQSLKLDTELHSYLTSRGMSAYTEDIYDTAVFQYFVDDVADELDNMESNKLIYKYTIEDSNNFSEEKILQMANVFDPQDHYFPWDLIEDINDLFSTIEKKERLPNGSVLYHINVYAEKLKKDNKQDPIMEGLKVNKKQITKDDYNHIMSIINPNNPPSFEEWMTGFESRYTEDQLWHMKWAFEVGVSLTMKRFGLNKSEKREWLLPNPEGLDKARKIMEDLHNKEPSDELLRLFNVLENAGK